nr:hypothetical protein [Marinobacterium stanieri]
MSVISLKRAPCDQLDLKGAQRRNLFRPLADSRLADREAMSGEPAGKLALTLKVLQDFGFVHPSMPKVIVTDR